MDKITINLETATYEEKVTYISEHGRRGTYTPEQIKEQIRNIIQSSERFVTFHDIVDNVIRQIWQEEQDIEGETKESEKA